VTERPRIVIQADGGMVVIGKPADEVLVLEVPRWAVDAIRAYREPTEAEITAAIAQLGGRA
jgi:hypothetical protein